MLKKYLDFINEQYQDLSEIQWNDRYDKAFGEYAINEQPFVFDENDREVARKYYGGVNVGVVYSGGRINSQEKYNVFKELKEKGSIKLNMASATPVFATAQSFAFFVKSYDEMTTHAMMQSAIKNGSSGKFGSYVLKLKPTPEQVIYSTFNDTKRELTRTAEQECIGDIQVEDVIIYDRLTPDTYKNTLLNLPLSELFNPFYKMWISDKKFGDDRVFTDELLRKKITSDNDAKSFIEKLNIGGFIMNIDCQNMLDNHYLEKLINNNINFNDGVFMFYGTISTQIINGLDDYLYQTKKDLLLKYVKEHSHDGNIITSHGFPVLDEVGYNLIDIINRFRKLNVNLNLDIVTKSEAIFYDIVAITDKNLSDVTIKELNDCLRQIEHFKYNFSEVIPLFSKNFKTRLVEIYQRFGSGYVDEKTVFKDKINYVRKIVTEILAILMTK